RARKSRTVGRHVQMMPTLISTVDQRPTPKKSQVGFLVSMPNLTRDRRRRTLTT
ncbi:hypothetical protein E4U43_006975, partial [Claviceps pusilla]